MGEGRESFLSRMFGRFLGFGHITGDSNTSGMVTADMYAKDLYY